MNSWLIVTFKIIPFLICQRFKSHATGQGSIPSQINEIVDRWYHFERALFVSIHAQILLDYGPRSYEIDKPFTGW